MSDKRDNRVLITGINGFTGAHLEHYLMAKGFDVYGTVIDAPVNSRHFQCDITQAEQIDSTIAHLRPDYLIHIAANSFPGEQNASLIYDVNVIELPGNIKISQLNLLFFLSKM